MRTHGILITTMNDFLGKKSGEVEATSIGTAGSRHAG
jgi:hypothetical protein